MLYLSLLTRRVENPQKEPENTRANDGILVENNYEFLTSFSLFGELLTVKRSQKNACRCPVENVFVISHKADQIVDKFSHVMQFDKKNNFSRLIEK